MLAAANKRGGTCGQQGKSDGVKRVTVRLVLPNEVGTDDR